MFLRKYDKITKIDLIERPVDSLPSCMKKSGRKLLLHFLVVVTLEEEKSIMVDKLKKPCCNRNVGVQREELKNMNRCIPTIKLSGVPVELQKFVDLIEKHNTPYNILSSNCWGFASEFAVAVVELLLGNVAANSDDEDCLKSGLLALKKQERPSPYRLFRFTFYLVLDDENNKTEIILMIKAEDFDKRHPKCKLTRRLLRLLLNMVRSTYATVYYRSSMMYFCLWIYLNQWTT